MAEEFAYDPNQRALTFKGKKLSKFDSFATNAADMAQQYAKTFNAAYGSSANPTFSADNGNVLLNGQNVYNAGNTNQALADIDLLRKDIGGVNQGYASGLGKDIFTNPQGQDYNVQTGQMLAPAAKMAMLQQQNPEIPTTVSNPGQSLQVSAMQNAVAPSLKRDLSKEQAFVQSWRGKSGRLPTSAEINQAVYGTATPNFSTLQGIPAPMLNPTVPGNTTGGNSGVTGGTTGGAGTSPITSITGGSTTQSATGSTSLFQQFKDQITGIQDMLKQTLGISPELQSTMTPSDTEKQAQAQIDALKAQQAAEQAKIATEQSSLGLGLRNVQNQPIAMPFITGQSSALQRDALARIGGIESGIQGISAQQVPLQDQLVRLQQERQAKQQVLQAQRGAAIDVAKTGLSAAESAYDRAIAEKKFEIEQQDKAIKQQEKVQEKKTSSDEFMAKDGYRYVSTPKERDDLKKQGYEITQLNGRTYARVPEAEKLEEVSAGASLYDPKTGKFIATAPKTYKGTSGGGSGGSGNGGSGVTTGLSELAQAVINNPALFDSLTPSAATKIIPELSRAGFQIPGKTPEGTKPLSGDAAKIKAIADTMIPEVQKLKQAFEKDYKGSLRGIVLKTDRELVKLVDNVADKVGRIRSGGAINKDEETRFKRQIASLLDIPFGQQKDALTALDGIISEAANIQRSVTQQPSASSTGQTGPVNPGSLREKYNY